MELKVWVEGIQRVICGVSPSTTCQDIVLALAHATGRTGRFTLIEKWRTTERPLAPQEQPLQVLQKWGEYATDVQFLLIQTDKDKLKPSSKSKVLPQDKKERFTHNFTPPQPADTSIKRSNTFSGAHSGNPLTSPARKRERFRETLQESSISEESETGSSANSRSPLYNNSSSSSKLPSPAKYGNHKHTGASVSSSINHKLESHSPYNSLERSKRRKSPHKPTQPSSCPQPFVKSPVTKSSSKPIPAPRARDFKHIPNGPTSLDSYLSKNSPPDFHEARSSSPLPEFEEYDLDRNFPSTSKVPSVTSQSRPGQPVTSDSTSSSSDESKEYSSLVKLVTIQQERLHMQESQMTKIESEIKLLEEKGKEDGLRLKELEQEIQTWEKTRGEYDLELMELEAARWPDQLELEKQSEESLKTELEHLRKKLENCERELLDMTSQKDELMQKIEHERKASKDRKKSNEDEKAHVTQEVADVQNLISEQQKEKEEGETKMAEFETELGKLERTIAEKRSQIVELETSLKEANLKEFIITPPSTPTSPSRLRMTSLDDGELPLFKQLSRPPGTFKKAVSPQDFSSTVPTAEHPDGVWV